MKLRDDSDKYMKLLWQCWRKELAETRASALWEEPGRTFRLSPGPISYRTIRWNLPFHVFMNGNQVRRTADIEIKPAKGDIHKIHFKRVHKGMTGNLKFRLAKNGAQCQANQ